MKLELDYSQYAALRQSILVDELNGIDPGMHYAKAFPGETEIEFVFVQPVTSDSAHE